MRILLFGENGQVARSFCEEAAGVYETTALGRGGANLEEAGAAAAAIAAHRPDVVVNAAAFTAVDKAEEPGSAAAALNARAPEEMARAAKEAGAPFIHISTDYVFDGKADVPYKEEDAANPINAYGRTKRDGEEAAAAANEEAVILRTSWVFSEFGGNFVKTMLRLSGERDEVGVVDDQIGGPTAARDIARTILTIIGKKTRGAPGAGLYHYQGAPAISWAGFAEKIFEYAKKNTTVKKIPTADYPTPSPRPLHTVLDCARIERDFGVAPPDWRIALRQVVAALE